MQTDTTTKTRDLALGTLISVRFRTGVEVHAGTTNSSMARCGRWLRHTGIQMRVFAPVTCEQCLARDPGGLEQPVFASHAHPAFEPDNCPACGTAQARMGEHATR